MTKKEKLQILNDWQNSYNKMNSAFDDMSVLMGCDICESDIFKQSFMMFDRYTNAVAILLNNGNGDVNIIEDWLSWYCYETKMGLNPMEAKAVGWKRVRKIKTLKSLLNIIEATNESI